MASAVYPAGLKHFAMGHIVWLAAGGSTIKATLIDSADYSYAASHEYMNLDTVPAAAKAGTVSLSLINTANNGVCDAADITVPTVSGDSTEAIIIWKDGGGGGTSQSGTSDLLIAYIEEALVPNGADVDIVWDVNGIFSI